MQEKPLSISTIEIFKSPIQLKEPFIISLGVLTHAENVIIRITTEEGIVGWGECSPFMSINGESMDTCFVVAQYLAKALKGISPLDMVACCQTMDKVIYANSSIKSAFDMALHDINAQHAGLPLYAFLGGSSTKELVTDYTVSIGEPTNMAEDAVKIKARGFQVIKVKLGQSKELDVERIRLIRKSVGMEIPIRIDANQGWHDDDALDILNKMARFNIQHCEEPIARWNFMKLPHLKKLSPIPIMADESCCDHHDAKRLIELDACHLFNVKLGKSGGILKALKILRLAEKSGIKMQVGGFLESRLAFTAAAHLALASDMVVYCDFDTPLMFMEDPVSGGITYDNKGAVSVPEVAGLGASFKQEYLSRLEKVIM